MTGSPRKLVVRIVRIVLPALLLALIALGPTFNFAYGSICTLSLGLFTVSCPLGVLQVSAAAGALLTNLLFPVSIAFLLTIMLGRVFCGWLCVPGSIFEGVRDFAGAVKGKMRKRIMLDLKERIAILGAIVFSSGIFRYPVFCVICPVGAVCRNVISYAQNGSFGFDLLFIPAIFAFEALLLPWCPSVCALGTTLRLFSLKNLINLSVNRGRCKPCPVCEKVCPVNVSPVKGLRLRDCTKCLKCSESCPKKAVEWKIGQAAALPS